MAFSSFNSIQTFIRYVSTSVTNLFNFPAVDPSLALYYPFDSSLNGQTPNFASGTPKYDATFTGSNIITKTANTFITGLGDLSLNNTMGSNMATNYVVSGNTFTLAPTSGLSISFWIACNGVANTTSTAVCLPLNNTGAKLEIDISGSTMIYSNVTTYFSNGYNGFSGCIDFSGNFMYSPNYYGNAIVQTNLTTGAIVNNSFNSGVSSPSGCAINGNFLYVSNQIASGTISQINLLTGAMVNANWKTGFNLPVGLRAYGGYLYVINAASSSVYKLDFSGAIIWQTQTTPTNVMTGNPNGVTFSGNFMYVSQYSSSTIGQFNLTTGALVNASWAVLSTFIYDVAIYNNTYLYVSIPSLGTVVKIQLSNAAIISTTWVSGLNQPTGIQIYNDKLYVFCLGTQNIFVYSLP